MTDQEKSKIICEKVGIEVHELKWTHEYNNKDYPDMCTSAEWECIVCGHTGHTNISIGANEHLALNPNLFTPDGQVVLAKALLDTKDPVYSIRVDFWVWLKQKYYLVNIGCTTMEDIWLLIIADTKLAELFYEFIQTEER